MSGDRIRQYLTRVFVSGLKKVGPYVGERVLDLAAVVAATVMVERRYGEEGLGIYSFAVAAFVIGSYGIDLGISRRLGFRLAAGEKEGRRFLLEAERDQIATGLLGAVGLSILAGHLGGWTSVREHYLLYPLLGCCILVHNINRLRIAALNGLGLHAAAACLLVRRRIVFVGTLFALVALRVPASFLLVGFLVADISVLRTGNKDLPMPGLWDLARGFVRQIGGLGRRLNEAATGFLTDRILELFLFVDFLVLGFFVSSRAVGAYAEALLLARLFLLVPSAMEPVLVRSYGEDMAEKDEERAGARMARTGRWVFLAHGILALIVAQFFPRVVEFFYGQRAEKDLPFSIFLIVIPGFLLYGAVAAVEPLYETLGREGKLRSLAAWVLLMNGALNLYLVPFAGVFGAAAATTLSLGAYFLLAGAGLPRSCRPEKLRYILGLGSLYVGYVILEGAGFGWGGTLSLTPFVAIVLLLCAGFFDTEFGGNPVHR